MNSNQKHINVYQEGPTLLRGAISGVSESQFDAVPIPGKWSIRQVICHIADFEIVYADRMKRVIAEDEPTLFGGDPDTFAAKLAYSQRKIEEELQMIEAVRCQMVRILSLLKEKEFELIGNHNEDGPLTLSALLEAVTNHIPHHISFVKEKLTAMADC